MKLDRRNYLLWKTLALPILKSYKLKDHLVEENPCPLKFIINPTGESQSEIEGAAEATGGTSSSSTIQKRSIQNLINGLPMIYYFWARFTTQ